jgi:phage gpG-like protein
VTFAIDFSALREEAGRVAEMKRRAKDLTVPLVDAARDARELIALGFATQSDPWGGRWKPLKPATKKRKGHGRILHETGELARSITARGGAKTLSISIRPSSKASKYGLAHQFSKRPQLPRRPFLPLDQRGQLDLSRGPAAEFRARLVRRITRWIVEGER